MLKALVRSPENFIAAFQDAKYSLPKYYKFPNLQFQSPLHHPKSNPFYQIVPFVPPIIVKLIRKLGLYTKYYGVSEAVVRGKYEISIVVRGRYVCSCKNREEGKDRYDLYVTVLKEKGLFPKNTRTNYEHFGGNPPTEAEKKKFEKEILDWYDSSKIVRKISVFKGVSLRKTQRNQGKENIWAAHHRRPYAESVISCGTHSTCIKAALAYDALIRTLPYTKLERIHRLNFRNHDEYYTESEANTPGVLFLGVSKVYTKKGLTKYAAAQNYDRTNAREKIGRFETAIEAAREYDKAVLQLWANKNSHAHPYPATNFSPRNYNYEVQEKPSKAMINAHAAINLKRGG